MEWSVKLMVISKQTLGFFNTAHIHWSRVSKTVLCFYPVPYIGAMSGVIDDIEILRGLIHLYREVVSAHHAR